MGGHGGLNILPQKKWNVYNYDNRAIVQKDKKLAAQKARSKRQKDRLEGLDKKLQVLRNQNGYQDSEQQQKKAKQHSLITQELKNLQQKSQHVNLFEKQQQILQNRDILEYKRLREAEFFKDKGVDYTSKFLGTYAQDKTKPWYVKSKHNDQSKQKMKRGMNGIELDMAVDKITYDKNQQRERSRQKCSEFYNRNSIEKSKRQAISQRQGIKTFTIKNQNSQNKQVKVEQAKNSQHGIEKLRQQRIKRQQKQRQKADRIKLLRMKQVTGQK